MNSSWLGLISDFCLFLMNLVLFSNLLIQGVTAESISGGSDSPEFGCFHSLLPRLFIIYLFRDERQLQHRPRSHCSCEYYYRDSSPSASLSSPHPLAHIMAQIILFSFLSLSAIVYHHVLSSKWIWKSGIGQCKYYVHFLADVVWTISPSHANLDLLVSW